MKILAVFMCPAIWLGATLGPDGVVTGKTAVGAILISGGVYALFYLLDAVIDRLNARDGGDGK